jgi:hypothetical protein
MVAVTETTSELERLNHEAFLALAGIYGQDEGQEKLAALLRSAVDIDPIVRGALADALSANGVEYSKVRLRLSGLQDGRFARQHKTRLKALELGQRVLELVAAGESRTEAESIVASEFNCSLDSAKKATDYARRFAEWEQARPAEKDAESARIGWQLTFHTADILGITPEEHRAKMGEAFAAHDADFRAGQIKVNR